jgi:hypothetical protein
VSRKTYPMQFPGAGTSTGQARRGACCCTKPRRAGDAATSAAPSISADRQKASLRPARASRVRFTPRAAMSTTTVCGRQVVGRARGRSHALTARALAIKLRSGTTDDTDLGLYCERTGSRRRRVAEAPRLREEATVADRGLLRRRFPERAYAPPRPRLLDAADPANSGGLCLRPRGIVTSAATGRALCHERTRHLGGGSRHPYGDQAQVRDRPVLAANEQAPASQRRRRALCIASRVGASRGGTEVIAMDEEYEPRACRRCRPPRDPLAFQSAMEMGRRVSSALVAAVAERL